MEGWSWLAGGLWRRRAAAGARELGLGEAGRLADLGRRAGRQEGWRDGLGWLEGAQMTHARIEPAAFDACRSKKQLSTTSPKQELESRRAGGF